MLLFFVVAILVAFALYFIPTILPMDPPTWNLIRGLAVLGLLIYAFLVFFPLVRGAIG